MITPRKVIHRPMRKALKWQCICRLDKDWKYKISEALATRTNRSFLNSLKAKAGSRLHWVEAKAHTQKSPINPHSGWASLTTFLKRCVKQPVTAIINKGNWTLRGANNAIIPHKNSKVILNFCDQFSRRLSTLTSHLANKLPRWFIHGHNWQSRLANQR